MWILTKALFDSGLSELGISGLSEEDFVFNLNEVVAFNRSTTDGYTTIWLKDGSISVQIPFEDFLKLFPVIGKTQI